MSLIKNMIINGMSLEDVLKKADDKNIPRKIFIEEYNKEIEKIDKEDYKLIEIANILKAQNRVDIKTYKIANRFCEFGNFKKGGLSSLYISDLINQNKYMLVFFSKRMNRLQEIEIDGYNEEYLKKSSKEIEQSISLNLLDEISDESVDIIFGKKKKEEGKSFRKRINVEINSRGSYNKNSEDVNLEADNYINNAIKEMLKNARNYKNQKEKGR